LANHLFDLTIQRHVQVLPWDTDLDVQVTESTMHYLANYYNMTVHRYVDSESSDIKEYLLEINPNYVNRSRLDQYNLIDARWVDTSTGLFIDITAVAKNYTHPIEGTLSCKDGHDYIVSFSKGFL
jgi:LicD family